MDISNDIGHQETEDVLEELEKRIAAEYRQAEVEVQEKLEKYLERFEKKDKVKLQQLQQGLITQAEYNQWKIGQIAMGQRWADMRNQLAEDYTNTDKLARATAYGYMPDVYAINHNYGTYQVEMLAKVDTKYTLYDRSTVQRLFDDNQTFYPAPGKKISAAIKQGKALAWNKKQVQSAMIQAILQGESMDKIAKRVAKTVGEKDKNAAIRNARTMTTGVQNAGRVNSYKRAQQMGIKLEQEWLATLDGRTRHEHRILDGQRAPVGKPFEVEGYKIEYPGDPTAAAHLIYNCRCTLVPALDKFAPSSTDLSLRNTNHMGNMTYEEWKEAHQVQESKRYREKLQDADKLIRDRKYEIAVLIDKNGKTLFVETQNNTGSVKFTPQQSAMMKGNTLTHNHPSGSTFSVADIDTLERTGLYKIKAVGEKDGYELDYTITRKKKTTPGFKDEYEKYQKERKKEHNAYYNKIKADNAAGKISDEEYNKKVVKLNKKVNNEGRKWLKKNASKFGYKYSEKRKKK